jgi:hypothetical protein
MSDAHIVAVRTVLENSHWVILTERLVDEYYSSAYWNIARPDGTNHLTLRFEGGYRADGLTKHTFNESYGCAIVEHPEVSVYFARINRTWNENLREFIKELNQLG